MPDHAVDQSAQDRAARWNVLYDAIGRSLRQRRTRTASAPLPQVDRITATVLGQQSIPIYRIAPFPARHERLDAALAQATPVPTGRPVELWQLAGHTIPIAGTHQIALARTRGQLFINAALTEFHLNQVLTREEATQLLVRIEQEHFFTQTKLARGDGRQASLLAHATPGTLSHIANHIPNIGMPAEAWYEAWFLPIWRTGQRSGVFVRVPQLTPADLYHWAILHPFPSAQPLDPQRSLRCGLERVLQLGRALQ